MKLLLIALLSLFAVQANANTCDLAKNSELILNQLLHKKSASMDELTQWKKWEALLVGCRANVFEKPNQENLAAYLSLGYVAYESLAAATREMMAGDIHPLFSQAQDQVLAVLKAKPQLIESACYYLGRYFGFEDQSKLSKDDFLRNKSNDIFLALPIDQAKQCIEQF